MKAIKRNLTDPITGRGYSYMNIGGKKAIRPYVTQQHWYMDNERFVVGNDESKVLYSYNVLTDALEEIDTDCAVEASADAMITLKNELFYRKINNEIWKMDLSTEEKIKLAGVPEHGKNLSVINACESGKYLTSYWSEERCEKDFVNGANRIRIVPRLNCETGVWDDETITKEFDEDLRYPHVGHPIINPKYENLVFFCHEGTTHDIPDRLWIADFNTGKTKNLFLQAEREDGTTGETVGHELWSADGEWMYFVKYTFAKNVGQSGLVRVSKDGSKREYINTDYMYWHVFVSDDQEWLAADTQIQGDRAEIVLVNRKTGKSHLLCNFHAPTPSYHPYQPHPIISHDNRFVSWQMVDDDGMLGCGFMDISDITSEKAVDIGFDFNDSIEVISYKGAESEYDILDYKGEKYYRVPKNRKMYLRFKKEVPSEVKLKISYLGWSEEPFKVCWTKNYKSSKDYANRENAEYIIQREHTLKTETVTVTMKDFNKANCGKFLSDFYISAVNGEVSVKNIEIAEE